MSLQFLSLLLLAAPAPTAAPKPAAPPPAAAAAPAPTNPVRVAAEAMDRCMTTFAVKLIDKGLSDDALFTVASTMCEPLFIELRTRISANLPKDKADEIITKLNANQRDAYGKLLQAIREAKAKAPKK